MSIDLRLSDGVRVEPSLVIRTAGLPASVLTRLRSTGLSTRIERFIRLRRVTGSEGEALAAALYEIIGAPLDGDLKPRLVGLRRALHRGRRPGAGEWNESVAARLPEDVGRRVTTWLAALDESERLRAGLPDVLAAEAADAMAVIRDAAASPAFRRALSQASPALFVELTKWLADGNDRPRRQSLVRLAKYVARAAARTSPYSTFTVSGAAGWAADDAPLRFEGPTEVSGVLELSALVTQGFGRVVGADAALAASLRLRVNPSVTVTGETLSFVGRPPDEPIVTLPVTPAIEACLAAVAENPRWTLTGLRDHLTTRHGAGERVERFLAGLVRVGLLEQQSPVPDLSGDPLGEWSGWLAARAGARIDVVGLVDRARAELRRPVPVHDVVGHDDRQRALRRTVGDLAVRTGMIDDPGVEPDKHIFHENAVYVGPRVTCSLPRWRPALEDLDAVRRWLAVFDGMLPLRVALGAFCEERFGPGARVPLLTFHRVVQEEMAARDGVDLGAGVRDGVDLGAAAWDMRRLLQNASPRTAVRAEGRLPRLRELDRLRREALRVINGAPDADGVVRVDPAAMAGAAGSWPEWIEPTRSLACYLQIVRAEDPLRLVLNVAYSGYGRGRTRLTHLLEQAGGAVPSEGGWSAEQPVPAELGGLFGTPLNVRRAGLPYEIDYPFTVSARPEAERVAPGELTVAHDPLTGLARLFSDRLDAEVRPLHVGMMTEALLPPLARLLALGFGGSYYLHPSVSPLADGAEAPSGPVVALPRVEIGRLVVRRARWTAPIEQVPVRGKGESDAGYLLRMAQWLADHRIPARCFVRVQEHGGAGAAWYLDRSRKPFYVDFTNWLLVMVFERAVAGAGGAVIFEEALPAPEDAVGGDPADPSVSEFLLEISERGDRRAA